MLVMCILAAKTGERRQHHDVLIVAVGIARVVIGERPIPCWGLSAATTEPLRRPRHSPVRLPQAGIQLPATEVEK